MRWRGLGGGAALCRRIPGVRPVTGSGYTLYTLYNTLYILYTLYTASTGAGVTYHGVVCMLQLVSTASLLARGRH